MDVYSHLLAERIIYLGTGIDAGVANALIAQLIHLESVESEQDVQLYINCEGGDPSAMLAVHDTMRYIRPAIATTCVGQAVAVGAKTFVHAMQIEQHDIRLRLFSQERHYFQ